MNALPLRLELRQRAAARTRCPFCREDCQEGEAYACASCLAHHHAACWREGQGCSVCRARAPLVPPRAAPGPGARAEDRRGVYERTLDSWGRLWAFYNVSVGTITMVIGSQHPLPLMLGGLIANACFLFGPALELALIRVGFSECEGLRHFLFWAGYLVTLLGLIALA